MIIKTYHVEHEPTYACIKVEINFDFTKDFGSGIQTMGDIIKMLVDFWSGSEERLKENEGNYLNTFLKQLCQRCMIVAIEGNLNTQGVKDAFFKEEGYLPMDGSCGIQLLHVTLPQFNDQEDYEIITL